MIVGQSGYGFVFFAVIGVVGSCHDPDTRPRVGSVFGAPGRQLAVCLDANEDFACDADEVVAQTDLQGSFILPFDRDREGPLLVDSVMPMTNATADSLTISPLATWARLQHAAWPADPEGHEDARASANTFAAVVFQELRRRAQDDGLRPSVQELLAMWQDLLVNFGAQTAPLSFEGFVPQADTPTNVESQAVAERGSAASVEAGRSSITLPFGLGMDFGVGYDALKQEVLANARCLAIAAPVPHRSIEPSRTTFRYFLADTIADLREKLELSLSFSLDTSTLAVSVEAAFLNQLESHQDSLFIVLEAQRIFGNYVIDTPFSSEVGLQELFTSDYDAFRKQCGDRYMKAITAGTSYRAIIELHTASLHEKLHIAARASGSYKPLDIGFEGSFELMLEELGEEYNYTIHILSSGARGAFIPGASRSSTNDEATADANIATLTKDIHAFLDASKAAAGDVGAQGFAEYPLQAHFAAYQDLLQAAHSANFLHANLALLRTYKEGYEYLGSLLADTREVLRFPNSFETSEDWEASLLELQDTLTMNRAALRTAVLMCAEQGARPCTSLDASLYTGLERFANDIPFREAPRPASCLELKRTLGASAVDGEYELFVGNNPDKPYTAFCDGMGPEATSTDTYLALKNTGHTPTEEQLVHFTPSYNFSKRIVGAADDPRETRTVLSVYSMLKVHPFEGGLVIADEGDLGVSTVTDCDMRDDCAWMVPYGVAHTCRHAYDFYLANDDDDAAGVALPLLTQIDLRGTGFAMAETVEFVPDRTKDVVRVPMTCEEAFAEAALRGGRLPTVVDAVDNGHFAQFMQRRALAETWLNLLPHPGEAGQYNWHGVRGCYPYRNWENSEGPPGEAADFCAVMEKTGRWSHVERHRKRPFIIEYGKPDYQVDIAHERQVVEIRLRERLGLCTGVSAQTNLILEYHRRP